MGNLRQVTSTVSSLLYWHAACTVAMPIPGLLPRRIAFSFLACMRITMQKIKIFSCFSVYIFSFFLVYMDCALWSRGSDEWNGAHHVKHQRSWKTRVFRHIYWCWCCILVHVFLPVRQRFPLVLTKRNRYFLLWCGPILCLLCAAVSSIYICNIWIMTLN